MATTINADTSNGLVITPDTSGELEFQSNGTQVLKVTSATGAFTIPAGTSAQAPTASTNTGGIRYDTDLGKVTVSNGTAWNPIYFIAAVLSSISGSIIAGSASTITLTGTGFLTDSLDVNFVQASDGINETITVTASSDTSASVTITSAIYSNVTAGNDVTVKVTNADNQVSGTVNTTAVSLPTGGTITTSGSYRIHTFTSSGTFTNTISNLSVEALIIAGGGGGGFNAGAPGGAGGYRSSVSGENSGGGQGAESAQTLAVQGYTVTVGGGGSGSTNNTGNGTSGSDSSFNGRTSTGGGEGATETQAPSSGGSGGGATGSNSGGAGTAGQGYAGGNGNGGSGASRVGSGGGGAGAAGQQAPSTSQGGAGGNGVASSITGSSVYRAGGGGGAPHGGTGASGGLGGGGAGNTGQNGQAGTANTGGGGGGGAGYSYFGGNGGSGVVIIRYQI